MSSRTEKPSCIQIFTKAPLADFCKTRLVPHLGQYETLQFHKQMVSKTITTASKVSSADIQLWCTPSTEHEFFQELNRQHSFTLHQQSGGTLGDIMKNALSSAMATYTNIIQIGTDCPYMDSTYINSAIDALNSHDAIIGPADDGGYVLLALSQPRADCLDGINWGSDLVLQQLEANLTKLGINYCKLAGLNDIDTFDDYTAWISHKNIAIPSRG